MLSESIHRLVFPLVVFLVVGTVWVSAWSAELQAEASRTSWPALPIPHREHRTTPDNAAANAALPAGANASASTDASFQ
jgi:hypothetical protein